MVFQPPRRNQDGGGAPSRIPDNTPYLIAHDQRYRLRTRSRRTLRGTRLFSAAITIRMAQEICKKALNLGGSHLTYRRERSKMRVQLVSWLVPTFGQPRVKRPDSGKLLWHTSKTSHPATTSLSERLILHSHAATKLGKALFPLFAEALDQSPDFFEQKVYGVEPLPNIPLLSR